MEKQIEDICIESKEYILKISHYINQINDTQIIIFRVINKDRLEVESHTIQLDLRASAKQWLINLYNSEYIRDVRDIKNRRIYLSTHKLYLDGDSQHFNCPGLYFTYYNFDRDQIKTAILNHFAKDEKIAKEKALLSDLQELLIKHNAEIINCKNAEIRARETDLSSNSNIMIKFEDEISHQTIAFKLNFIL